MRSVAAAMTALLAAACVPNEGPLMKPFSDCLGCHTGGHAQRWSVAGTWTRGARVEVIDANGKSVTLIGNKVGNFYTAESLAFPLRSITVDGVSMPHVATNNASCALSFDYGGCNACHAGATITTGPLMAPGSDCMQCHGSGGIACTKFTAAGTFSDAIGATVTLNSPAQSMVANPVGNFYFTGASSLSSASVSGRGTMSNPGPSCNTCHHGSVHGAEGGD